MAAIPVLAKFQHEHTSLYLMRNLNLVLLNEEEYNNRCRQTMFVMNNDLIITAVCVLVHLW